MKLKKSTWALLAIALLLGGGVYSYETFWKPEQETSQAKEQQLFTFSEKDIKGLTIETAGKTLKFERKDTEQPWQMLEPEKITANDAAMSFLLNLLVDSQINRSITVTKELLKDYSLEPPFAKIMISLANNQTHQLLLGKPDLEDQYIYAQLDPQTGTIEQKIIFLPKEFQYAVERDLMEWKQPKTEEGK